MVRTLLAVLLGLGLSLSLTAADDKKTDKKDAGKGHEATITKVDAKNHTLTVKMKDKDGKDTEKTFKLAETVRYLDSTGKAVAIDVFKSGDDVLILEADGQVKEVHQKKGDKK
jgi:3-dehydroquinate synthase class II